MDANYWLTNSRSRISRRRALAVSGAALASAALLAACGSDGKEELANDVLMRPTDTTTKAARTGVMKDRTFGDPPTLDMAGSNQPLNAVGPMAYSTLVQFNPGYLEATQNEVAPDVIESWEWSPDGLQIVLKVRQGIKWHNKAPVNGRALDIEDLVFSWNRFAAKGSSRARVVNAANAQAPVLSITSTDSRSLVVKLKEPLFAALGLLATNSSGSLIILPKETDTTFDPRANMIGTGPFMMTDYTPSVGFTFKRHPDYWDKNWALVEQIDLPILSEYATGLAQLKAGNMYTLGSHSNNLIRAEDVLPIKRDEPRILVYEDELAIFNESRRMAIGWQPAGKSPFRDVRVRQAMSLAIDRDIYLETFHNVSQFSSEGLPVQTRWNSHLLSTYDGWWLDPRSKEFGPNAQYISHNVAEAKKLLAAAGYPNGIQNIASSYVTGSALATGKHAEVMDAMLAEVGISSKVHSLDYQTEYIPSYRDSNGQYEGWAYLGGGGSTTGEAVGLLESIYWSKAGTTFLGFDANGNGDQSGDPQVDALIEKARVEQDVEKRRGLVFDLQRHLAKSMYSLMQPGAAVGFTVAWPCIGNFRVYRGGNNAINRGLWVDSTKPPFTNT